MGEVRWDDPEEKTAFISVPCMTLILSTPLDYVLILFGDFRFDFFSFGFIFILLVISN